MKNFVTFFADLLWLAAAAAFAYYFLWTFLAIEGVAAVATLILRKVERGWQ